MTPPSPSARHADGSLPQPHLRRRGRRRQDEMPDTTSQDMNERAPFHMYAISYQRRLLVMYAATFTPCTRRHHAMPSPSLLAPCAIPCHVHVHAMPPCSMPSPCSCRHQDRCTRCTERWQKMILKDVRASFHAEKIRCTLIRHVRQRARPPGTAPPRLPLLPQRAKARHVAIWSFISHFQSRAEVCGRPPRQFSTAPRRRHQQNAASRFARTHTPMPTKIRASSDVPAIAYKRFPVPLSIFRRFIYEVRLSARKRSRAASSSGAFRHAIKKTRAHGFPPCRRRRPHT